MLRSTSNELSQWDAYFTKEQRMKTLDDIRHQVQPEEELNEGKFIRRGTALLFAKNARAHGNQAEQFFKAAKQKLSNTDPTLSPEDKQKLLLEGLSNICDGMISLRNQNGAITGIVTTSALFGERGDQKMTRLLRKR